METGLLHDNKVKVYSVAVKVYFCPCVIFTQPYCVAALTLLLHRRTEVDERSCGGGEWVLKFASIEREGRRAG